MAASWPGARIRPTAPIFDLFGIDEEITRALGRRVDLKSGGYLIIDQTEALTTVDVNTGGFVGARNFDDTIFKTNLEAAGAIARQLRLRNLGGIIIVDFIDMAREEHRDAVLAEFRKQLARDCNRTTPSCARSCARPASSTPVSSAWWPAPPWWK